VSARVSAAPLAERPSPLYELLEDDLARTGGTGVTGARATDAVALLLERALGRPLADVTSRQGKGVRARLVRHAFAIANTSVGTGGDDGANALPAELPLALEALHAGSLVIDDVQDEADERRGAPALHKLHGVPLALNAGNWLYFWPLALVGRAGLAPSVELAIRRAFEDAVLLCHAGQALDLSVRVTALPRTAVAEAVAASTRWKTGALFSLATTVGALAAEGASTTVKALATFGEEAGVALQMADDVSSLLRPTRRAKAEEDLRGARPTWPWAWIAESLDDVAFRALQATALAYVHGEASLDDVLERMRPHVEHRGRVLVRRKLDAAFAELRAALPATRQNLVDPLEAEVRAALEALHGE
jgi:geranylgeranyl pyrophosphate synthase